MCWRKKKKIVLLLSNDVVRFDKNLPKGLGEKSQMLTPFGFLLHVRAAKEFW